MYWTSPAEQCIVVPMNDHPFPDSHSSAMDAVENRAPSAGSRRVPLGELLSGGRGRRFESSRSDQSDQGLSGPSDQCVRVQRNRRGRDTTEVYAIRAGDFVKIGLARDSQQRLGELQTSNPLRLSIVFTVHVAQECAYAVEQGAHRYAKRRHHAHGEWFSLTDNQARKFIRRAVRSTQEMEKLNADRPPEGAALSQAIRLESAAQRNAEIAARRVASRATFAAVRAKFKARRDRGRSS